MTETPFPLINPHNRLFATMGIDEGTYSFEAQQLPSTYYMNAANEFARLRPLHSSGFAVFDSATRRVVIYTGAWDRRESLNDNVADVGNVLSEVLGNTSYDITTKIGQLKQNTMTTNAVRAHNQNPQGNLNHSVVYISDGDLKGCFFGGDHNITGNRYSPMRIADARQGTSRAHTGHGFVTKETAESYYQNHYPGILEGLMQLGQLKQQFKIDLSPKGRALDFVVETGTEYFAEKMFDNREEQSNFIRQFIMSFL